MGIHGDDELDNADDWSWDEGGDLLDDNPWDPPGYEPLPHEPLLEEGVTEFTPVDDEPAGPVTPPGEPGTWDLPEELSFGPRFGSDGDVMFGDADTNDARYALGEAEEAASNAAWYEGQAASDLGDAAGY